MKVIGAVAASEKSAIRLACSRELELMRKNEERRLASRHNNDDGHFLFRRPGRRNTSPSIMDDRATRGEKADIRRARCREQVDARRQTDTQPRHGSGPQL